MIPVSIIIAGVLIAASVLYSVNGGNGNGGQGNAEENLKALGTRTPEIESYDAVLGEKNAPVTFFEFGDYQCPFCGKFFAEVESLIRKDYVKTGKINMVWRDFAFLGPESRSAAYAAQCAKEEGRYWEYHDAIMIEEQRDGRENNGNLTTEFFTKTAKDLELNVATFSECLSTEKYKDVVTEAYQSAVDAGVNSTPTAYVGGRMVKGALPYSAFQTLIDEAIRVSK